MRNLNDFHVVTTGDGSPSLSIADSSGYVEKMHHGAGAFAESLYIYGAAVETLLHKGWPFRVVSMGLGLAYNEILAAGFAVKYGVKSGVLISFETEALLKEGVQSWLIGSPTPFADFYGDISRRTALAVGVSQNSIRDWLANAEWQIRGAFPDEIEGVDNMTCILYDAFSNKMCADLWEERSLIENLDAMTSPNCIFSTYAVTGSLKRALKALGFTRIEKPGFAGKRESTFAVRETQ